jgi:hypothetical protein
MELEGVLPTCHGQIRVLFIPVQRRERVVDSGHCTWTTRRAARRRNTQDGAAGFWILFELSTLAACRTPRFLDTARGWALGSDGATKCLTLRGLLVIRGVLLGIGASRFWPSMRGQREHSVDQIKPQHVTMVYTMLTQRFTNVLVRAAQPSLCKVSQDSFSTLTNRVRSGLISSEAWLATIPSNISRNLTYLAVSAPVTNPRICHMVTVKRCKWQVLDSQTALN